MTSRILSIWVVIAACITGPVFGQAVSGTILGTVTDVTGAVLAGAKVNAVNEGTGSTRTVTSDGNGEYTFPSLPTGRYTVMAEVTGFKALAVSNIELGVDQRARIDLKLETGSISETMTVEGKTPLVQTSSSELGTTITNPAARNRV